MRKYFFLSLFSLLFLLLFFNGDSSGTSIPLLKSRYLMVTLPVDEGLIAESGAHNWAFADWPKGVQSLSGDKTFGVYSKNATAVMLEIYEDSVGSDAVYSVFLDKNDSDNIWRARLSGLPGTFYYAYRCWGPNWIFDSRWSRGNSGSGFIGDVDASGNRFNPNKVLNDPYGREMSHDKKHPILYEAGHTDRMYGSGQAVYNGSGSLPGVVRRNFDTGRWAPKSIYFEDDYNFSYAKPGIPQKDAMIVEAHLRGLTMHESSSHLQQILSGIASVGSVPEAYRGTYKGASYMAQYFKALGINTVEFLPIQECNVNDFNDYIANSNLTTEGENYWGYMTSSFFSPDRRYAYDKSPGGPTREFKQMIDAFHKEGIEVYLDVVYNHTGEYGNWKDSYGNLLNDSLEITCYNGFDSSEYYRLYDNNQKLFYHTTGCGNQLNASREVVQDLVEDSLVYWITEMGVDGFRFDLAPVLGREESDYFNYHQDHPLLQRLTPLISRYNVELIAEAWDAGGGYAVGNFPAQWGDWNDHFRDRMRRFIRAYTDGTGGNRGWADKRSVTDVMNGTYDAYYDYGLGGPHKSVNFIDAHDGFTMMDLVSYNDDPYTEDIHSWNQSLTWPFGPSDGGTDATGGNIGGGNISSNTNMDHEMRRVKLRNFWTLLYFSRGIPMTVWGDEFGRTQNGNNNPYNVDSVATWNNYWMINSDTPHNNPNTRGAGYHNNYGTENSLDGKNGLFLYVKNLISLRKQHETLRQDNYSDVVYHFRKNDNSWGLSDGDYCIRVEIDNTGNDNDFLIFINTWSSKVDFTLTDPGYGKRWERIISTASWAETNNNYWPVGTGWNPGYYPYWYGVNSQEIVVFIKR